MFLTGKDNKLSRPYARKRSTFNDDVKTEPEFAKKIIDHFSPQFKPGDTFLEPCAGDGAFYDNLPEPKDWCEIVEGEDFLLYQDKATWIISNFPWTGKALRPIVRKACQTADNVVHLIRLHNVFGTVARHKDFMDQGHRLKEIVVVPWKGAFINKSPEGFCLCVIHTQKGYTGDCKWTYWI